MIPTLLGTLVAVALISLAPPPPPDLPPAEPEPGLPGIYRLRPWTPEEREAHRRTRVSRGWCLVGALLSVAVGMLSALLRVVL